MPSASSNPRRRYTQQRWHSAERGIPFLISFEVWWALWQASGKWHERGWGLGQYCMARKNDRGPYALDNVKIITNQQNLAERTFSEAMRAKLRASRIGQHQTPEAKAKIRAARCGQRQKPSSIAKMIRTTVLNKRPRVLSPTNRAHAHVLPPSRTPSLLEGVL
jgi:hypothetical protein